MRPLLACDPHAPERRHTLVDEEWKIPAPAELCGQCEQPLQTGALIRVELDLSAGEPTRRDLCEACGESVEIADGCFSWQQRRPDLGDSRPMVDYGLLREVFGGLVQRPDTKSRRLAYLVALVLVRKRHLRLLGFERQGGQEIMRVRKTVDDPEIVVPAPHLSSEALLETRGELMRLLSADLPLSDLEGGAPEADPAPSAESGDAPG